MSAKQSNVNKLDYFMPSTNIETDKEASNLNTQRFTINKMIFTGIGCSKGMFKLRMKEGSCLYQVIPRSVTYTLKQPLREELDHLQKQQIPVPSHVDEASE